MYFNGTCASMMAVILHWGSLLAATAPQITPSTALSPPAYDEALVGQPLMRLPRCRVHDFGYSSTIPQGGPPWIFICITPMFDSHGRLLTACFAPHEATVVLADPDSLEVLSYYRLEVPSGNVYGNTGRQAVMRSTGASYSYLDAQDRLTIVSGGKKILTLKEGGSAEAPEIQLEHTYDLTSFISEDYNDLAGVMVDWQGRIWFTTAASTHTVASVGLINPKTWSNTNPTVKWFKLPSGELIRNTFAVTKSGEDRASAYVVSSQNMYRLDAGGDDQPYKVWSAPGFARIDIDEDGKGCTEVWTTSQVATTTSPRLSTKTGLIYTVSREYDPNAENEDGTKGVYVYYWIALDFSTGRVVWKKMAGTGDTFDSFYPALAIGPDEGLYVGAYGGFMTMRDAR